MVEIPIPELISKSIAKFVMTKIAKFEKYSLEYYCCNVLVYIDTSTFFLMTKPSNIEMGLIEIYSENDLSLELEPEDDKYLRFYNNSIGAKIACVLDSDYWSGIGIQCEGSNNVLAVHDFEHFNQYLPACFQLDRLRFDKDKLKVLAGNPIF